jgi:type I protein arginine methyltransferase
MSSHLYSLDQFASMFADRVRMDAYAKVIATAVRPDDTVVDLGCGVGIFALMACRAGARRVYAIDLNGVVEFGRHLAAVNGFGDRIQFLCGDSRQIHLPERADVIISDLRGVLPLFSSAIGTLEDARIRFLAEGGRLVPQRDTLICAIVENQEQYRQIADVWRSVPELELSAGLPLVLNGIYRQRMKPEQVLSQAVAWHRLDYPLGAKTAAQAVLELPVTRTGVAHGLGLWFETELLDGLGYSTEPRSGDTVYGHTFLPWLEPVHLRQGEVCHVDLRAHLIANDYVWQWETSIPASDGRPALHFRQSTFYGSVFSPSYLRKRATDFVPVLSENGLAERWLFQAMDGQRSIADIAADAVRLFPHVFRRVEDACNRAAEIAEKFSR